MLQWQHQGIDYQAAWRSENGQQAPRRVEVVDDTVSADAAYRMACEGTGLLWVGDFHNARHLMEALKRRLDKPARSHSAKARKAKAAAAAPVTPAQAFHLHRQVQGQRARVLSSILIALQPDYAIALRRAPDWRQACVEAWGEPAADAGLQVVSLRELLGVVGAHEWRKKGVAMPVLGKEARIYPHYGVFSPVRGEYVQMVKDAPLPQAGKTLAFDIGVGTGVLSAVLVKRGVQQVIATDMSPRALACAKDNLQRLGLQEQEQVQLQQTDLFPEGQAGLIVCNPPWVPARAVTTLEQAVYDDNSAMLRGFLNGLRAHLLPGGEGWLILSDLAEHLGLRSRAELEAWIADAGLYVVYRMDTKPVHGKAQDASDPLHAARAAEVTSLWRLAAAQ